MTGPPFIAHLTTRGSSTGPNRSDVSQQAHGPARGLDDGSNSSGPHPPGPTLEDRNGGLLTKTGGSVVDVVGRNRGDVADILNRRSWSGRVRSA